jgi:hypothetical protein
VKQAVRIILAMALGFGMTIAAVEVSDQVAVEAQGARLGRLDFYTYCEKQWGRDFGPMNPSGTPYGWTCDSNPTTSTDNHSVNVDLACVLLYGAPSYADTDSTSNQYGWDCYRGPEVGR